MRIYANFVYGFDGYTIDYLSTSPEEFNEDMLVMYCDLDNLLTDCTLDWEFSSQSWKPYKGEMLIDYFLTKDGEYIPINEVEDAEYGCYGTIRIIYDKGKEIGREFIKDRNEEIEFEHVSESD
jgi:hypothetical protein